jgi:hypothetical protein
VARRVSTFPCRGNVAIPRSIIENNGTSIFYSCFCIIHHSQLPIDSQSVVDAKKRAAFFEATPFSLFFSGLIFYFL